MNPQAHERERHLSGRGTQRSKSYLPNNPYGSLERKALKQRRAATRKGGDPLPPPPVPEPNIYNPYNTPFGSHRLQCGEPAHTKPPTYRPPPDYRKTTVGQSEAPLPAPAPRPPPAYNRKAAQDRQYAANVQQASRRLYDSSSTQPFQMLDNPYNTTHVQPAPRVTATRRSYREFEQIGSDVSDDYIAPIRIDAHSSEGAFSTDSSSAHSSPKENAFNFFGLGVMGQSQERGLLNQNPYSRSVLGSEDGNGSYEQSKPFEMRDFYQYSERLRRARGMSLGGEAQNAPPPPPSNGRRTPSSPGRSLEGSRSASPFTYFQQGK